MGLTGLAVIASNAGTSCLGAAVVSLGLGTPFWAVWRVWWIADGMGMLILAPTLVMWVTADRSLCKTGTVGRIVEAVCLYASLVVMSQVIFGVRPEMEHGPFPLPFLAWPYMVYPFLFWAALRFGPHGALRSASRHQHASGRAHQPIQRRTADRPRRPDCAGQVRSIVVQRGARGAEGAGVARNSST